MTSARSDHTVISSRLGFLLLFVVYLPSSPADITSYSPDLFVLENEQKNLCISVNESGLFLSSCKPFNNDMLWKWGTGRKLYNIGSRKCLGLDLRYPEEPLAMMECDSDQNVLSWQCINGVLIGIDFYKLAAVKENVAARKELFNKWRPYGSFGDKLCDYNFQEIFTLKGNVRGKPCVFPFKFNNSWFHECTMIGRQDRMPWCATTVSYDKHKEWGFCPISDKGCGLLWEENKVTHTCYQFNLQSSLSWKEARESCQAQGADLLSIRNLTEHEYISKRLAYTGAVLWTGLHQLDTTSGWQWSDGSPFAFVNWRSNFRSYSTGQKQCGVYDTIANNTWYSLAWETRLPYACKKYLTPKEHNSFENWKYHPTACEDDWIPYNGYCYKLHKEMLNWAQASATCVTIGGELMQVTSLAHMEFLQHFLQHEKVTEAWIGMTSKHKDPVIFQWSDGSEVTFTSWHRQEPNISQEDSNLCVSTQTSPFERHRDYCYGVNPITLTYEDASDDPYCPLAIITDRYEQAFITSLLVSLIIPGEFYFWIALQDVNSTGEYTWTVNSTTQRPLSYTNWNVGQPSHNGGCVVVTRPHLGHWEVKDCNGFLAMSLCKKPLTTAAKEEEWSIPTIDKDQECPPLWNSEAHLDHCYKVFHHEKMLRKRTWQEAESLCQDLGAHLVSFSHLDEEKFVTELLSTMFNCEDHRQFWIGFSNSNPFFEGSWQWSDGTPVASAYLPNINLGGDSVRCAAFRANKTVVATDCEEKLEWVCKIPKGVIPKFPDWHNMELPFVFYQGNNYLFSDPRADFDILQFVCGWLRGYVASIHSEAEQEFIHRQIKKISKTKEKWWIGIVYENPHDGLRRWKDGSPLIYSNWEKEPESSDLSIRGQQCAYIMSDTGLWGFSDCSAMNPGICKTSIMFRIEKDEIPKEDDKQKHGTCPVDWLYYGYKCYLVHKTEDGEKLDWQSAANHCKKHGGQLATISDHLEQAFIVMQLFKQKNSFWFGLSRDDYDVWENGTSDRYTNWYPIKVNHNSVSLQDHKCAAISADHNTIPAGKWHLENCSHEGYGFICEKEQDVSGHNINGSDMFPILDILPYGHKLYRIISGNMTWYDASFACKQYGADLVTITDEYHQAFATVIVHRKGYSHWIGFYKEMGGKEYEWADGSISRFTSWADESPSEDGNCAYIDTTGLWRILDCNVQLQGAICLVSTENRTTGFIGSCPEDWIQFQEFCYSFAAVLNNTDYHTAEEICQQQDSRILSLMHEKEVMFLQSLLSSFTVQDIWLNRKTPSFDGTQTWSDGSALNYSHWNTEISYVMTDDTCVTLLTADGTWVPTQCTERRGFICKKQARISEEDPTETRTSHVVIPVAVLVSLVLLSFFIPAWYLLRKKRCHTDYGLQDLTCMHSGSKMEESILIAELEDEESK
ncbi:secretory phospholipase A2 receptor [Pyxicephalus adspersus]|uniref:secretory phospholipase A2 receptor n=1 Tax=Pyxicephalus adspersus TaxID=30357 RepID=UPI003B58F7F3